MEILLNILIPSTITSAFLIVWFKTDAFVEYGRLLGLSRVLLIKEYEERRKSDPALDYYMFLFLKNNCFITRLLSCPLCLGFWLSLIFSIPFGLSYSSIVYVFSLILFFYLNTIMHERN